MLSILKTAKAKPVRMFALTSYRQNQTKTFGRQKELPRLPVPKLEASLEKYLTSLRPFFLQEASQKGLADAQSYADEQLAQRAAVAQDFSQGLGAHLQQRLIDVDRTTPHNWLDDKWWIKVAYHTWRVPLIINSNWWILCADDVQIPKDIRQTIPPAGTFTDHQIKRAAKMAYRTADFKVRLDRQEILPDSSRAGRSQRHWFTHSIFGISRIPQIPGDELLQDNASKHIVVFARDHFYKLAILDDAGDVVPLASLEAGLRAIADDAAVRPRGEGVGVCTADTRDKWTVAREHLLVSSEVNRRTIDTIERSLFAVALEDETLVSDAFVSSSPNITTPDLDAQIANAGKGAGGVGRNRWWDKTLTLTVENNGRAGVSGEHSPCDALIPAIVIEYVLAEGVDGLTLAKETPPPFELLPFELDAQAHTHIAEATATVKEIVTDSDTHMLWFDDYGVDWIKKEAHQPPDAYLQMALQLAYYKVHGAGTATYETASTRLFKHGRTEVIRTFSADSFAFVQAMVNGAPAAEQLALLSRATKSHSNYTRESSTGRGCDRHLLGLKLLLREGETHPFFADELFGKSQEWLLSTSGLTAGDYFFGTGFGSPFPNGYGINYLGGKNVVKFGIESKFSDPHTSTDGLRNAIVESLREMRRVCEAAPPAKI